MDDLVVAVHTDLVPKDSVLVLVAVAAAADRSLSSLDVPSFRCSSLLLLLLLRSNPSSLLFLNCDVRCFNSKILPSLLVVLFSVACGVVKL